MSDDEKRNELARKLNHALQALDHAEQCSMAVVSKDHVPYLEKEVARLRAENARLRKREAELESVLHLWANVTLCEECEEEAEKASEASADAFECYLPEEFRKGKSNADQ